MDWQGVVMAWKTWAAVNLRRVSVASGEWVTVVAGYCAQCDTVAALVVDGVLRLDGAIRVG